jgi:hypothetical protein
MGAMRPASATVQPARCDRGRTALAPLPLLLSVTALIWRLPCNEPMLASRVNVSGAVGDGPTNLARPRCPYQG